MQASVEPLLRPLPYLVCKKVNKIKNVLQVGQLEGDIIALPDGTGFMQWSTRLSTSSHSLIVYSPQLADDHVTRGWFALGQRAQPDMNPLQEAVSSFRMWDDPTAFARPLQLQFLWDDRGSTAIRDGSAWRPICPDGGLLSLCLGPFHLK